MVLNDSQEYSANILAIGSEGLHSGLNSTIYLLCDLGLSFSSAKWELEYTKHHTVAVKITLVICNMPAESSPEEQSCL